MVFPLCTTSRLSVSIVILVVFTTMPLSAPPIAARGFVMTASCRQQPGKVFNSRFNISQ